MFQSLSSFLSFRDEKKHKGRYFHSQEVQEFLNGVLTTVCERVESIPKGQRYWRAQKGSAEEPCRDLDGQILDYRAIPYPVDRMKPSAEKVGEGRVNVKGISCLYLATDEKTVVSEVRPWVGTYVTLVEFEVLRDLTIVDCSRCEINPAIKSVSDLDMLYKVKPPPLEEVPQIVWRWIDLAFSEPVDRDDSTLDYVPTQIIAELFKKNGFDGIKYRSVFNSGSNLALFDLDSAQQVDEGKVVQVTRIDLDYQQIHPVLFGKSRS
jgi:hypothetical protein